MKRSCLGARCFFSWKGFAVITVFEQADAWDCTLAALGLAAEACALLLMQEEMDLVSPLLVIETAESSRTPGQSWH